ncbi:MAG: hypothetical protein KY447_10495 [Actinobacteria bacterium]|nr:hypothetical protein [Actinomycetota bacterium]MBW3643330.1 hypothetical protein [Actinomycetota bacterium]
MPDTWTPGEGFLSQPDAKMARMENSLVFARAAQVLVGEARRLGLVSPGFCSPPRRRGTDRSLRRRWPAGPPVVAVRLAGRSREAVLADMVEGVLVANGCRGAHAEQRRRQLWAALGSAPTTSPLP